MPWATDEEQPGPACYCGRRGCIETFLSGPGLEAHYRSAAGCDRDGAAALAGDSQAQAALARYEDRMARALAAVVNLLDPDVIVLGGGMSNLPRLYQYVPALIGRHLFCDAGQVDLRPPRHGDSSGVRGAA